MLPSKIGKKAKMYLIVLIHLCTDVQNIDNTKYCVDVEHQELSFMLMGLQNGTDTVVDSMAIAYEIHHTLTI